MLGLLYLVVAATAICVAVDASRLGARRGVLGGGLLDMGPAGWFFACLLIWIVGLPCYLAARPRLVRRAQVLATHPQFAGPAYSPVAFAPDPAQGFPPPASLPLPPSAAPSGPPAGYYTDPEGGAFARWWDGGQWAPRNI